MTGRLDSPLVRHDVPLAAFTTFKVGGPARYLAEVSDEEQLLAVLDAAPADLPVLVLGRGSNVVVSDEGYDGLIVRLRGTFLEVEVGGDGIVRAGAGVALPRLARAAAAAGRGGLEFYLGIPGSVGGAVRMNAGGHGRDTAAVLRDARIMTVPARDVRTVPVEALGLGYRSSALTDDDVVLGARFVTVPADPATLESRSREIARWRREHQPGGTRNAGSVFKNPPGTSAGRLIDEAGLKGLRRGGAMVSTLHANFLVAEEGATARDIWELVGEVRRRVEAATGIRLEPELRFVGRFEGEEPG